MVASPTGSAAPALPRQPSSKSTVAAPKLNSDMEMGTLPTDGQAPGQQPQQEEDDIMQLARVGDIPAMEKLFETGGLDATYTDDEGITPLHVCSALLGTESIPLSGKSS